MGITHLDEAPRRELRLGHLQGTWTFLGEAAGSEGVGVRRIQVDAGGWSTPAHEHGRQEEIFYVLGGRGLSWQAGATYEIGAGDVIVYHAGGGAHSLNAKEPLDVLAFGPRDRDESVGFPRLGLSLVGNRAVESVSRIVEGLPIQFVREAKQGAPELPAPSARPGTIVHSSTVPASTVARGTVGRTRRALGRAAGSLVTGLAHIEVAPGKESSAPHCHSVKEGLFVVLDGTGSLLLGDEQIPLRAGHVVSRPAGTGVAHTFRAGGMGLGYLAYGPRQPGDLCYYPRSSKVLFRGLGLMARIERVEPDDD